MMHIYQPDKYKGGFICNECGLHVMKYNIEKTSVYDPNIYYVSIFDLNDLGLPVRLDIDANSISCEEVIMKEALE